MFRQALIGAVSKSFITAATPSIWHWISEGTRGVTRRLDDSVNSWKRAIHRCGLLMQHDGWDDRLKGYCTSMSLVMNQDLFLIGDRRVGNSLLWNVVLPVGNCESYHLCKACTFESFHRRLGPRSADLSQDLLSNFHNYLVPANFLRNIPMSFPAPFVPYCYLLPG